MTQKAKVKMSVDLFMAITLLLLMAYQLISSTLHEVLGVLMFGLFIFHHLLNWNWMKKMFKRKQTVYSLVQTISVLLMIITMIGSMMSGIFLLRHLFTFLSITIDYTSVRVIHQLAAYWGFILMAGHSGLHWGMTLTLVRKLVKNKLQAKWTKTIFRMLTMAIAIAIYGCYAFRNRQIGQYLFL